MMVLRTFLALGLLIWTLPPNTFARPFQTASTSTVLLSARVSPNASSSAHYTSTPSTAPLAINDPKDSFPDLFDPPASKQDTGPHVPTAVIVLFPSIVGFSIMGGLWLCFARRKPSGNPTGDSTTVQNGSVDRQPRQGDDQLQPQLQRQLPQQHPRPSEDDEAPPPYSREPP